MEQYAANFGKGIEGKDLVYFAKVEHERTTGPADRAVQLKRGSEGPGQARRRRPIFTLSLAGRKT